MGWFAIVYSVKPEPGQRVIFAEIVENGAPVIVRPGAGALIVVAAYRAPGPWRLGGVAHLHVGHRGARVLVSFTGVVGAHRHAVTVTVSGGQHVLLLTTHHALTIAHIDAEFAGEDTAPPLPQLAVAAGS